MDGFYLEFEEVHVPEAICLPFHGFDLVVGPLEGSSGDGVIVVGQDAGPVSHEGIGKLGEHGDTRIPCLSRPVEEERLGCLLGGLGPELPEILLHVIGASQGLIEFQGLPESVGLPPVGTEVFRVFQKQPAGALQDGLVLDSGLAVKRAPEVGELVIEQLDDMKMVKHDGGPGQVLGDRAYIGWGHVDGHGLDFGPGAFQSFPEGREGLGALAVPHKDHCPGLEVQDNGEIAMPLADADLVNGYPLEILEARMSKALLEVAPLDVLDHVPAHAQMTGHVLDGHVAAQLQGVTLEAFGVGAPGVGKTDLGLSYHLTGEAEDTADAQGDPYRFAANGQAAELPPSLPFGVNLSASTARTGQPGEVLLNGEDHLAAFVSGAQVLVASHPEAMIQETCGHDGAPPR